MQVFARNGEQNGALWQASGSIIFAGVWGYRRLRAGRTLSLSSSSFVDLDFVRPGSDQQGLEIAIVSLSLSFREALKPKVEQNLLRATHFCVKSPNKV